MEGDLAVIGAPNDGAGTGAVKVYDVRSGALLHVLRNPLPEDSISFGAALALEGTRVVVGARCAKAGLLARGR